MKLISGCQIGQKWSYIINYNYVIIYYVLLASIEHLIQAVAVVIIIYLILYELLRY